MTIARSETERRQKAQDIIHILQRIQTGNTAHRHIDTLILLVTIKKSHTCRHSDRKQDAQSTNRSHSLQKRLNLWL